MRKMSDMDIQARTCRALEWDRLKQFLAVEAQTAAGKMRCLSIMPHDEPALVEQLMEESKEALSLLSARSDISLGGLADLGDTLARLRAGAVLHALECLDLKRAMLSTKSVRTMLSLLAKESFPRLTEYLPLLYYNESSFNALDKAIDDDGNLRDDATPQLRGLRKEVKRIDGQIKEELARLINQHSGSKALQEPLYTQRNGRYVLPVNVSLRGAVPGIVHDSSASGLTVYVEPLSVVEMSNKMRLKETEVEREIYRILSDVSQTLHGESVEMTASFDTLIELDAIMSRGRLATKYNGIMPELTVSDDYYIRLKNARHPLLVLQQTPAVIGNDIEIGGTTRTLVITGPNTGGKTVLLKTIGLLALMIKAGLLIPAQSGTFPIFKKIFADIGDEQSLEQSLSTFSSHMTNIVRIIDEATPGILVLLDEIGAGTDPREGAALARSVLEHLNSSGAVTVFTTHFGELKTLAYTESGFINGSLAFDEVNLTPTYKLRLGLPGSSKATTIARRLGLKSSVADRAETFLEEGQKDVQRTVEQLEERLKHAAELEEELERAVSEAQRQEIAHRELFENLEREKESQRLRFSSEIEREFKETKTLIKELISDLQKQPNMARAQKLQTDLEALRKELGWTEKGTPGEVPQLQVGQQVRVVSLNQKGTIVELPPPGHRQPDSIAIVQSGLMKLKVPLSDLQLPESQPLTAVPQKPRVPADAASRRHTNERSGRHGTARRAPEPLNVFVRTQSNTIDLRGQRVDSALSELERFLDESFLHRVSPVMVIHGHGTGAIRSAVRDYLCTCAYSTVFRPGEMHEGGDGVTIVELD